MTTAVLIAILIALAALHLYWGLGGVWPGADRMALQGLVVGAPGRAMPGPIASAAVAAALAAAAAIVWLQPGAQGAWGWLLTAGYIVLILVFTLRGLAPYVSGVFDYAREMPFYRLNRLYYSPLCLLIAALLIVNLLAPKLAAEP